ncbi:MAG: macro domain-containing protein, partial [Acidaminococcaceae bacterium]|nr:macro domain-containing protein [Acidaminococcaceae bacterium]
MSVTFIRGDITKLQADAIVNAANNELRGGGGVDGAIHKAAGSELYAYCKTLGGCPTGGAKISPGFNLPAKYIIHTVGPVWRGGAFHEKTLLTSCYLRSLELAHKHGCKTVAFPLISAGAYGYPYNDALQIAYDTCNLFLKETKADIDIFIVLYQGSPNVRRHTNRTAFELPDTAVFKRVAAYIRENYHFNAEEAKTTEADSPEDGVLDSSRFGFSKSEIRFQIASKPPTQAKRNIAAKKAKKQFTDFEEGLDFSCDMGSASAMADSLPAPAKEKKLLSKRRFQMASGDLAGPWMLDRENLSVEETFTQMLLRFMEEKHMTPP